VEQQRLHIGVGEQARLDVGRGGRGAAGEGGGAGHGLLVLVTGELDHLGAGAHRRRREATVGIDACQSTRSLPFFSVGGLGRELDLGFRWGARGERPWPAPGLFPSLWPVGALRARRERGHFRPWRIRNAMQLSENMTMKNFAGTKTRISPGFVQILGSWVRAGGHEISPEFVPCGEGRGLQT
jgi:hypothetical protein